MPDYSQHRNVDVNALLSFDLTRAVEKLQLQNSQTLAQQKQNENNLKEELLKQEKRQRSG